MLTIVVGGLVQVLEANAFDTQYTMYDNGYDCTRLAASLPGIKRRVRTWNPAVPTPNSLMILVHVLRLSR